MDPLYTSRFWVDLLTKLFVLMFVSMCKVNAAQSSKMAVACFNTTVCSGMTTLSCNDQQIIRLVDQQYNYVKSKTGERCKTGAENNSKCNQYRTDDCCLIINEGCMAPFTKLHTLNLFETCSGKQDICSATAQQGSEHGCMIGKNAAIFDSNFLTYDCDNETDTVHLCSNMSRKSNSINVIFNGASTMTSYTTSQTCSCSISGSPQYHAYLQDFRPFRPKSTSECSSISLNGYGKMCKGSKLDNFIYQSQTKLNITNHTITTRNLFSHGPDDRPTMMWIRIKTNLSDPNPKPLTVTCTGATPSPTSRPNGGTTQAATSDTSDGTGVPSAAIVVPIVLVLIGLAAGVGLWYWRKRRKAATEKNTNISIEQQNVTSGVSSGRISGTDRTYDLPEEEEYSTTDGNGLAQSSCELDNYGYIVPAVTMRADDTPEYEVPVHVGGGEEHAYSILDKVDQQ